MNCHWNESLCLGGVAWQKYASEADTTNILCWSIFEVLWKQCNTEEKLKNKLFSATFAILWDSLFELRLLILPAFYSRLLYITSRLVAVHNSLCFYLALRFQIVYKIVCFAMSFFSFGSFMKLPVQKWRWLSI